MKERTLYDLIAAQDLVILQCKYTLFKRVVNITFSAKSDEKIDWDIMRKTIQEVIKRNDCLRLRFCKKDKKIMQYFVDEVENLNIKHVEFKTQKQQENFIKKETSKPTQYMKGEVIKVFFCKSYDGKDMLLFKVCHLILDMYGINILLKDIFDVYTALKNGESLPPQPNSFEEIIKKDLLKKNNESLIAENKKFYQEYLEARERPYYAGVHGLDSKLAKKEFDKHSVKMFFINCDTEGSMFSFSKELVDKIITFCEKTKTTPANLIFYACSLCQSKMNNNVENLLQLELCNCRATAYEKNTAGTKVQSVGCYININQEQTIDENLKQFKKNQFDFYKHIGISEMDFTRLVHNTYHDPFLRTYFALTFSFIPMKKPKGVDFQIYSNGKCALPAYVAAMYDVDSKDISMVYDCQTKLTTREQVKNFHYNLENVLNQIVTNTNIKIKDLKI